MDWRLLLLLTITLLIASKIKITTGQRSLCVAGDVRLVGGSSDLEGRVEVCSRGRWGTVCDDGWGRTDASVVCRQLGHAYEGAIPRSRAYFGRGSSSQSIILDDLFCTGTEQRLIDCNHRGIGIHNCGHGEDAGVTCQRLLNHTNIVLQQNISSNLESDIEAIRLVNGEDANMGRLEVLYNGTWGTVCDDFWSYSDAKVACRMFGYDDAGCAVTTNRFGIAGSSVPIWMDNVQCTGSEEVLDQCDFAGWGNNNCNHQFDDAGIVCVNRIGVPHDAQLVNSSTTTLTIRWTVPELPNSGVRVRYYISYQSEDQSFPSYRTAFPTSTNNTEDFILSLTSLTRDTEYAVQVRVEVQYSACSSSSYFHGNYSDLMSFRTNATFKRSTLPIRLVPPYPEVDFMGRVEVFYNNQWGTICDDFFSVTDGNVVCRMLNFTEGALCTVSRSRFGRGTGPIWLDNVDCTSGDEVLEDCRSSGWGVHNCDHGDDVGVICRPSSTFSPVMNLTVTSVSPTSVTVRWNQHSFPRGVSSSQYQVFYVGGGRSRLFTIYSSTQTEYTLTGLGFEQQYNISVRARMRFSYCYSYINGGYSDSVSVTTMEKAPDGPPTSFDLEVINSTAIEAMWELPRINDRNGVIRGYKLFVQSRGREVRNITIPNNETLAYIVGGLQPATPYTFSILAYTTVGDGPQSIHLTAVTLLHDPLIIGFGIYGNSVDKVIKYTYNNGFIVHCTTSNDPSITSTDWFFSNGTKVGIMDSNLREGHYNNGTTVLEIRPTRRLSSCDGGNYTCVVNTTSGRIERRSFHLVIGSPPTPSRPTAIQIKSTSITIGWSFSTCDGGHIPETVTIRYRRSLYRYSAYTYITVADPSENSYMVTGLTSTTLYYFSVQVRTVDSRTSSYSVAASFTTLPPGPSEPRSVSVRLVRPLVAEVSWRLPATPNGVITHYTVYAIPLPSFEGSRRKRQAAATPKTIQKVFPSSVTTGNVTLTNHSITYQFQVSASVNVGQNFNEGGLSPTSPATTLFVPTPGLPEPVNVRLNSATRTSITLVWEYPPPPVETIGSFLVTYSAEVEGRSPGGTLVQFEHSEELSVTGTTATLSPLIPGTRYEARVSAVTSSGRGQEMSVYGTTLTSPESEKLAYFQLRVSPIINCLSYLDTSTNTTNKLLKFRSAIVEEINLHVCSACGLTAANIIDDEFSCRGGLTNQIVYRAMIIGTEVYSAPNLVSFLQSWVSSGSASITVSSSRLHLDKDCQTSLDTLDEPDCPLQVEPPPTTPGIFTTMTTAKPEEKGPAASSSGQVRAGEIGGFLVGGIIILLLAVLIFVIAAIAIRKYIYKPKKSGESHDRFFNASFSDIGSNRESVQFDFQDTKEDLEKSSN